MRNIEIKAKIEDPEGIISKLEQTDKHVSAVIKQHDIFFHSATGRLKLRKFQDGSGELIQYERQNAITPQLSTYEKVSLNSGDCLLMDNILTKSNGRIGVVNKTRRLYLIGQTRVHIDNVEGLGDFLELEVVLKEEEDVQIGEDIAKDLMITLGIKEKDLIANAYIDLLTNTHSS